MSKKVYPTGRDLQEFLEGCGFAIGSALDALLDDAVAAGRSEIEQETGRVFLAAAGTREYDPPTNPQGLLMLNADLCTLTSLTVGGTAYTLGTNFHLLEANAADDGKPYWGVQFQSTWTAPLSWGQRRSVVIAGTWGYGTRLGIDVWTAMLERSAYGLWGQLVQGVLGGIVSWSEGDLRIDYGAGHWSEVRDTWKSHSESRMEPYRRWS